MAVSLVRAIKWFVGHSGDDKPTDAPVGSMFFEFDTPSWWVWDGSDWHEQV